MLDETLDQSGSLNATDESQDLNTEEQVVEKSEAEIRAEKAEKKALDQELRAKKAEQALKALKSTPTEKQTSKPKYSLEEIDNITALTSVAREDRQEVLDYADRKGLKPVEALNTPFIKAYLKNQAEERATAAAANTGTSRRGATSGGDEIEKVKRGEEVDMDALAQARIDAKRKERGLK